MEQYFRPGKPIALLIVALIICLGIAALAFSRVSLASLQSWLASATYDGKADFLTIERYQKLVLGTRLLGSTLLVLAAILWFLRRLIANIINHLLIEAGKIIHDLVAAIKKDSNEEGAWHLATLALLVCGGLALRLSFIGIPIRYDEATTYLEYASKPIPVLLSYYSSPNNHLFHSLLVHFSTWFFGNGLWAIRLPALIAGWLTVPAAYLAFRLLYNKQVGLTTAALTAVCPVLVEFSVNARGYSLVTLLFLMLLSLGVYLRAKPNLGGWVLFTLVSAVGMWTVPTMVLALAVVAVWWFLSPAQGQALLSGKRNVPMLAALAGSVLLTALLYLPVVLGTGWQSLLSASGAASREPVNILLTNALWGPWLLTVRHWPELIDLALLALLMLGFLAHWISNHKGAWIGFAGLIGPALVMLVLGSNPYERVWLFLCPVVLGIAAVGLDWITGLLLIKQRQTKTLYGLLALALLMVGLGLYTAASDGIRGSEEGATLRDAAAITKRIATQWRPGDALLTACPADEPLAYQFKRRGLPMAPVFALLTGGLEKAGRIWVVAKPPPGPLLADLLKSAGNQTKAFHQPKLVEKFPQASLYLMNRKASSMSPDR